MKTREEQRFNASMTFAAVLLSAQRLTGTSFCMAEAVEYADTLLAKLDRTADAGESLTVDLDAMLAACIPGGNTCDPQEVADSIREWYASHIVGANKKVPDLLEIPWTCTKCGKETRNKHGYCDACTGVEAPDTDGWIPHVPGDPMPCDGDMRVWFRCRDGYESVRFAADMQPARNVDQDWWTGEGAKSKDQIIAWKPAE